MRPSSRPTSPRASRGGTRGIASSWSLFRTTARERGVEAPAPAEPEPFDGGAPERVDLSGFGAAVFTGGFRPDYRSWLPWPAAFDDHGFPLQRDGESTVVPGLLFVGVHFLRTRKSALLMGVGEDAAVVARADRGESLVRRGLSTRQPCGLGSCARGAHGPGCAGSRGGYHQGMLPRRALIFLGLAWVLVMLYPDPGMLVRSVRNVARPRIEPQAVAALAARLPDDPRADRGLRAGPAGPVRLRLAVGGRALVLPDDGRGA